MTTMHAIHELLARQAQRKPEAIAIAAPGRVPLTYGGLYAQLNYTVQKLNEVGLGRNDRVAIVLPNGPGMAVAFLAVASGATSAPLNPAYTAQEFDFYLSDLKAKALLVQAGLESPARAVARTQGIPIIELLPQVEAAAGIFTLSCERASQDAETGFAQPGEVALVLHTSGTTSRPKLVPLTHTNLCLSAHNISATLQLSQSDRCLNVMPLFHIHGLIGATLSSLAAGGSLVCTPGFKGPSFFQWLAEFQPSWYTAVPSLHQAVLEQAAAYQDVIARCPLRFIRSSSAALPAKVMLALERAFKAPVIEAYGMTEASHQMASNPLPPHSRKMGSVGLAAGPEVAIMDGSGHFLPRGATGEIVIRGETVTGGYENNPAANESVFVEGWFRTGDHGYLDDEGYLFVTGRLKEIINRGGEKVAPREVDEVLLEHPAVVQAVTFAVSHPTLGEDIAAAVVLREPQAITEGKLREFAFTRLAEHKVPSQVVVVSEIPKGSTGKVQRLGLAELLSSQLKAEFVAPREPVEVLLAGIWAQTLEVERVGIYDNFFSLGGDSLRATQVIARVRGTFQVDLPLKTIFREPTVAAQALAIEEILIGEIEGLTEEEAWRRAE